MALMLGAFMLHGITPGPMLLAQNPGMFWGVITSMFVGNVMLLVLNLPLIGLFAKLARLRTRYLMPVVVVACIVGAYGVNNNTFDIFMMLGFGVFGYYAERLGFSLAPLVLAFVLGPLMETALRQSLVISDGTFEIFVTRPISGTLLALTALMIFLPLAKRIVNHRALRRAERPLA
jgi:putative tricarboxylic transport membrane protein